MHEGFDSGETVFSSDAVKPDLAEEGAEVTVGQEERKTGEGESEGTEGGGISTGPPSETQELDEGDEDWADQVPEVGDIPSAAERPETASEEISGDDDEDWAGEDSDIVNDGNSETVAAPDDESFEAEDEDWASESDSAEVASKGEGSESVTTVEENRESDGNDEDMDDEDWAGEDSDIVNNGYGETVAAPDDESSDAQDEDWAGESDGTEVASKVEDAESDPTVEANGPESDDDKEDWDDEDWADDELSGGTLTPEPSLGAEDSLGSVDGLEDWAGEEPKTISRPGQENAATATGEPSGERREASGSRTLGTPAAGFSTEGAVGSDFPEARPLQNEPPDTSPRAAEPSIQPQSPESGVREDQGAQTELPKEVGISSAPQDIARAVGDTSALRAIEGVSSTSQQIETVKEKTLETVALSPEAQQALKDGTAQIESLPSDVIQPVRTDSLSHASIDVRSNEARIEAATTEAARRTAANLEILAGRQGELPETTRTLSDPLPRDEHGWPIPESPHPHTELGMRTSKTGDRYRQAREFDDRGKAVREIDFTNHGRKDHTNPHQHRYDPTTGKRLGPEAL